MAISIFVNMYAIAYYYCMLCNMYCFIARNTAIKE